MKVENLDYYDKDGEIIENIDGETMFLAPKVIKECLKIKVDYDVVEGIEKFAELRKAKVEKLYELMKKIDGIIKPDLDYTQDNDLESLIQQCDEILQEIDIRTMFQQLSVKLDKSAKILASNLHLLNLMVLTNQGVEFAAKKLKEDYVVESEDE